MRFVFAKAAKVPKPSPNAFSESRGSWEDRTQQQAAIQMTGVFQHSKYTQEETHMEPENGPLEDDVPVQPNGSQVPC